jgi:16S rRNA processing protein RimM
VAERICVAQIGAAHGTRGELKLWSFTADPMAVKDYGPLETEDGKARFEIEAARTAKTHLVVRLSGVHDRTAAERLVNARLFVPRERLPAPADDEYYHADLIGLPVFMSDGRKFGIVVAIHDFGAGDILELRPDGEDTTVMLPFTTETVPEVDVAQGRIVINPPEGALGE